MDFLWVIKKNNNKKNNIIFLININIGMRDARKLFRLFKSINEYQKIIELIKKGSLDPTNLILQIGTRLGFLLYWFFDNIAILCAIKFINRE